jgi:SAM-dependent methyltransferase
MHDDAARWNDRYATASGSAPVAPEVVERWPELDSVLPSSGRAADVACGPGAVSLWLADRGLRVTALDVSDVAIGLLESQAIASGLTDRIDARTVDLDHGVPADLDRLDLVVCQRFRDPTLYPTMVERLVVGGIAVVTVLSEVGTVAPGPFHAPAGELSTAFGADGRCEIIRQFEGAGVAHVVIRRR